MIYNIYHLSRKVVRQRACPLGETAVSPCCWRRVGTRGKDPRWFVVTYVSAVGNGGGSPGNVSLASHDLTAPPAKRTEPRSRWYGGMGHGMGRMFGLPESW